MNKELLVEILLLTSPRARRSTLNCSQFDLTAPWMAGASQWCMNLWVETWPLWSPFGYRNGVRKVLHNHRPLTNPLWPTRQKVCLFLVAWTPSFYLFIQVSSFLPLVFGCLASCRNVHCSSAVNITGQCTASSETAETQIQLSLCWYTNCTSEKT